MIHTATSLSHLHSTHTSSDLYNKKTFSLPFCEQDALQLQEIFVTCGIHAIKAKNIYDGRKVIQTILHSLNYFNNIGCISNEKSLPSFVCDIMKHIELENQSANFLVDLERFLTVHPCFDFIWIELSAQMLQNYPLHAIVAIFEMYHVQERMPVVIVTYDEE